MGDVPTNVIGVRLRLLDVWGGDDVIREMTLAELETSERGIAVGPAFYPWRRVVSYEWEVLEAEPDEGLARPRQLLVRVLTQGGDGPEEHRVAADRFEVGPWSVSMVLPDRVDPETQRSVLRRITFPWHRVLEYERMLAEATTAAAVPDRPDIAESRQLADGTSVADDEHVVIDVAAVERESAVAEPERTEAEPEPADAEHASVAMGSAVDEGDDATARDATKEPDTVAQDTEEREPVAVGSGARVKKAVPRKTGQRRKRPRSSS
jgi:hypothetical protein